jgi:hypothetical protein
MTATVRPKRKPKAKAPSSAELKRQISSEKAKNDNLSSQIGELTSLVKASIEGQADLRKEVELLKMPTPERILSQHNKSERVISTVLGEADDEPFPDVPEEMKLLPAHLRKIRDEFSRQGVSLDAKNNPVTKIGDGQEVDSTDHKTGQFEPRLMKSDGPASESLAPLRGQDTTITLENGKLFSREKFEIEMFMHETVLVLVHDSTDETQIPIPSVNNGGDTQYFIRGKQQWVRRKYIEPLARAKKTTYTQKKIRNSNGDEQYINIPHTTLMYPFVVLKDTPRGKAWLRNILAEPA